MNTRDGPSTPRRPGLTLIEVLVVISISAILLSLSLVAVQRVRGAALRVSCASNLRQISLAVYMYHDSHQYLPPGCAYPPPSPIGQSIYYPGVSWHSNLLAYLEQDALAQSVQSAHRADPFARSAEHHRIIRTVVPGFLCPAESRRTGGSPETYVWAYTSYLGIAGSGQYAADGVFHPGLTIRLADVTDGTSNTVMIGERPPGVDGMISGWYSQEGATICALSQVLPTSDPTNYPGGVRCSYPPTSIPLRPGRTTDNCHLGHFWSLHVGGAHFAYADGSVRFLSYETASILPVLATRADGDLVPSGS